MGPSYRLVLYLYWKHLRLCFYFLFFFRCEHRVAPLILLVCNDNKRSWIPAETKKHLLTNSCVLSFCTACAFLHLLIYLGKLILKGFKTTSTANICSWNRSHIRNPSETGWLLLFLHKLLLTTFQTDDDERWPTFYLHVVRLSHFQPLCQLGVSSDNVRCVIKRTVQFYFIGPK